MSTKRERERERERARERENVNKTTSKQHQHESDRWIVNTAIGNRSARRFSKWNNVCGDLFRHNLQTTTTTTTTNKQTNKQTNKHTNKHKRLLDKHFRVAHAKLVLGDAMMLEQVFDAGAIVAAKRRIAVFARDFVAPKESIVAMRFSVYVFSNDDDI
jgi:hypothetical protein